MFALLPSLRLAAFGVVILFSLIVLVLSAHVTSLTQRFFGGYFAFAALSIATALLSMASLTVMLVVDSMRNGAFTSMIVVELAWLGLLWVLWLSSGGSAADATRIFPSCSFLNSDLNTTCHEFSAVTAFAFLNWIILIGYTGVLLTCSIIATTRGNNKVWTSSVKNTNFFAAAPATTGPQPAQTDKLQENATQHPVAAQPGYLQDSMAPQYPPQGAVAPGWTGQPAYNQSASTPAHSQA